MKIATASEMREIDHKAINEFGIPEIVLMENAGVEVVKTIETMIGSLANKKICVFVGKGNNGGDGLVASRHLSNQGAKVKVFLLGGINELQGAAKINYDILCKMGIDIVEVANERDWDKMKIASAFADCLVDSLLGLGYKGELSSSMKKTIGIINEAHKPVVAVDIPSGVNADTGQIATSAVKASYTMTFGLPKPGLLLYPGASFAGEILVSDIGIPNCLLTDVNIRQNLITVSDVRAKMIKRLPDAHKGNCGKVLVLAGSKGLTGAAVLTSTAALRSGAGLVTLAVAETLHDILETKLTEVMTVPLPDLGNGSIGKEALESILEIAKKCDVLAIGPGLGTHEETKTLVQEIILQSDIPLIIDADAITAIASCGDILTKASALPVITPHPGEMSRLIGLSPDEVNQDRIYVARQAAELFGSIVVLKGARSIVAFPDGEVYINISGNAGMATGGTGDVLTGIISAMVAQGLDSHTAAIIGVYIHGLAGDIAAKSGMIGLLAGDIINSIPSALHGAVEE
ncbi:NAD(P)H-hydrate dehydratase [Dendrosporobacter sp. 1207_IL3150]|uniref:NAD(P)H-hydrate dehydratase n=1 Tax=Dendrosporobacter sp. 1207_IL3150 TaxID=3084054 RepID=UPI002FDB63CF